MNLTISKSKIKTLESCPRCFLWQYIERRKPDIPPAVITKVGKDVHEIFDKFYDHIVLEQMLSIKEINENPFEYFKSVMNVLPQYKNIYDLFCEFQSRRWKLTKNKDEFMPVLKEHKFIVEDNVGIVDVIHYDNGEYMVLDYKSSVSNPTNLRFELNYYVKLINDSKILDKPVKFITAYGYKDGSLFHESINIKSYNSMLKKIEDFRKNDWGTMEFPKNIGYSCSWCQYLPSCNKL